MKWPHFSYLQLFFSPRVKQGMSWVFGLGRNDFARHCFDAGDQDLQEDEEQIT